MKKIKLLSILCILCLALSSCGGAKSDSPKDAVSTFFNTVKDGNYEKLAELVVDADKYDIGKISENDDENKEKTEIMIKAMSKIKFEIKDEKITDKTAVVNVSLDIPNIGSVVMETMQEALTAAFAEAAKDDSEKKSQDEVTADIEASMIEKLKGDIDVIKKDLEIKLVQKDGKWLIEGSEDLANAVSGNMVETMKGFMNAQ